MAATHTAAFTQSRPWSEAEFTDLLDSPFTFTVGDARCFALVRVIVDEAELLTIATHPDHQRQGLARAVMQVWRTVATQRGAETAFLEVAADNAPACELYTSCGFSNCGNRPGYYSRQNGPAVDAILMRQALPTDK
ncbi:ribosomal-protein-alanine acetyltransferase [Sedimentitalea sp. CY04]|uniref:Ribosomal-protein-alanine acetyltransferase n=2 Tax=Parasedimentitalea denitrificans TaxID=2211118 RepID=A0ABX0WB03_9RHOB|nr:ribosomal-protein-alanine acetyltransferase [Sedimentitalea sp. CY04]